MTITNYHSQACFEAWMNCENLLLNMTEAKIFVSKKITRVIDECALLCMGTFKALKSSSANLHRMALLCVGICEECAELLEEQKDSHFRECAKVCRECSNVISPLAFPAAILQ